MHSRNCLVMNVLFLLKWVQYWWHLSNKLGNICHRCMETSSETFASCACLHPLWMLKTVDSVMAKRCYGKEIPAGKWKRHQFDSHVPSALWTCSLIQRIHTNKKSFSSAFIFLFYSKRTQCSTWSMLMGRRSEGCKNTSQIWSEVRPHCQSEISRHRCRKHWIQLWQRDVIARRYLLESESGISMTHMSQVHHGHVLWSKGFTRTKKILRNFMMWLSQIPWLIFVRRISPPKTICTTWHRWLLVN